MISALLLLFLFSSTAFAGSICPPRENIYPCSCFNVLQGKKIVTTSVYCHHVESTDSLTSIFPTLRSMQIDILHLYDSFWNAHKLEKEGEDKKVLPTDWLTLLKVKEIDIVDTHLSNCFACNSKLVCKNLVTQRFSVTNSSSHDKICTLCDSGRGNKYSWTSCMSKLRHLHFTYGKLTSINFDMFPYPMKELTILNLTHNEITTVDAKAMANLPRMKSLDLSHNVLQFLENMFTSEMKSLEFLDVSWNSIQTLGDNFFSKLQYLKTFNAGFNQIVHMKESEWKKFPDSLRNIDLTENPLYCDCNIVWVNSSFHVSAVLVGRCSAPEEYEDSLLRKASRLLNERCVGSSVGTRDRKRTTKPIKLLRKRDEAEESFDLL